LISVRSRAGHTYAKAAVSGPPRFSPPRKFGLQQIATYRQPSSLTVASIFQEGPRERHPGIDITAAERAAQGGPYSLDLADRNAILDEEIKKCPTSVSNGRYTFPIQVKVDRSTVSAVVTYGRSFASPLLIVCFALLASITGGLILPYWLYKVVRPKYNKAISVDEKGVAHWKRWVSPAEWVLAVGIVIPMIYAIGWITSGLHS
jgi:rRNA maturation protein Nop10